MKTIKIMLLLSFCLCYPLLSFAQEPIVSMKILAQGNAVVVTTDKEVYVSGDVIQIAVVNNLETGIFTHIASMTPAFFVEYIEKRDDNGIWEKIPVRCTWPECDSEFDGPGEIKPGETKVFFWEPSVHINTQDAPLEPGTYRVVGSYQIREGQADSKNWKWEPVFSNEFNIK